MVLRQTAKMTSEFVFFSSNPSLNHIKIEKCLLLIATNTNIFTLLLNELKTDGKSFIFAVCRLTYDHVTSNLISLIRLEQYLQRKSTACLCVRSVLFAFSNFTGWGNSETWLLMQRASLWGYSVLFHTLLPRLFGHTISTPSPFTPATHSLFMCSDNR